MYMTLNCLNIYKKRAGNIAFIGLQKTRINQPVISIFITKKSQPSMVGLNGSHAMKNNYLQYLYYNVAFFNGHLSTIII